MKGQNKGRKRRSFYTSTQKSVCVTGTFSWVTTVTTSELLGKLLCNCDHKSKETGQGGEDKK